MFLLIAKECVTGILHRHITNVCSIVVCINVYICCIYLNYTPQIRYFQSVIQTNDEVAKKQGLKKNCKITLTLELDSQYTHISLVR